MHASLGSASRVLRPRALLMALGVTLTTLAGCAASTSTDETDEVEQLTQGIQTFPNQGPAFDFFVGKGLTPAQSAGIVGNLSLESGVDPTIKQIGGGPGRGLAQWQVGGRWDTIANDNVLDYAAEQGQNALSLGLQLDFIWYELTTFSSYGLASLKSASSASAAATTFAAKFEGCPACDMAKRIEYAEDILARFGNGSGSSSSGSGGVPCTVEETGESGDCVTTSECAARGNSISTPGYCPGSSDVQCCTALESTSSSGGSSSSGGASSSGGKKPVGDGGSSEEPGSEEEGFERSEPDFGEGGCSTSGTTGGSWWLAAALWLGGLRRRRA